MNKPGLLRAALVAAMPEFARDPDRLAIFIDKGRLVARRTGTLGYEWRYQLRIFVDAFTGGADRFAVPLLIWISANQPDLMLRFDQEDSAITFAADILDDRSTDLLIQFELSEAVTVAASTDPARPGWELVHLPDPTLDEVLLDGATAAVPLAEIWLGDERLIP